MAQFSFTAAQEILGREVRDLAQRELTPEAKERAKSPFWARDLAKRMGELEFLGISLPEKYERQRADWVSPGIAIEELSKVDFVLSLMSVVGHYANPYSSSLYSNWQQSSPVLFCGGSGGSFRGVTFILGFTANFSKAAPSST